MLKDAINNYMLYLCAGCSPLFYTRIPILSPLGGTDYVQIQAMGVEAFEDANEWNVVCALAIFLTETELSSLSFAQVY